MLSGRRNLLERIMALVNCLEENRGRKELSLQLRQIVTDHSTVFAVEDSELTQTSLVEDEIDTGDAKPIRQKARNVPLGAREELKKILDNLLDRGIIEHSKSEWASSVVLVRKKDGSIGLCVECRQLNKCTKHDAYPLPGIDAMLQSLRGKQFFSTLDMAAGYWQIPHHNQQKRKVLLLHLADSSSSQCSLSG